MNQHNKNSHNIVNAQTNHLIHVTNTELYGLLNQYVRSESVVTSNRVLAPLEFDKKVCRTAFRNSFSEQLPTQAAVQINSAWFNKSPLFRTSGWKKKSPVGVGVGVGVGVLPTPTFGTGFNMGHNSLTFDLHPSKQAHLVGTGTRYALKINPLNKINVSPFDHGTKVSYFKRNVTCFGIQLLSAHWVLEQLTQQLTGKKGKNPRTVLNTLVRDVAVLMRELQSRCPVLGLRVAAAGRLSKRKKGMAQKISKSIGKVPIGSFRNKVDYSQGSVKSPLGSIGLKVWVCYA